MLKTHYGYIDGSGEYFVSIESDLCDGCGLCVQSCPQQIIELVTEFIDLEDKTVAAVKEDHRKKISYSCSACKPDEVIPPCVAVCKNKAIECIWKPNKK